MSTKRRRSMTGPDYVPHHSCLKILVVCFLNVAYRSNIGKNHPARNNERKGQSMITALVRFKLPQPVTREKAQEIFSSTAPKYREVHGLIRKYYLLSEDGGTAGGVYLWKSREQADQLYSEDWRRFVREKYGTEPSVAYFETPVIVDNLIGEIVKEN